MQVIHSTRPRAELTDVSSGAWAEAKAETVSLDAIPIDDQPNRYIRAKWNDKPYGTVKSVAASACASADELFVRLEWADDATPNGEFADAAAIVTGSGSAATLGDENQASNLWFWAADRGAAERFVSNGPGVFRRAAGDGLEANASLQEGTWRVVVSGPLADVADDRIGLVVWNGSNEERAGLGAVSGWITLERG
jgi:DMSO reductase family type II enzyme heme b subunit